MIIVNFSTKQYFPGQDRLRDSLNGHRSLMIRDYMKGWPKHKESPYEFKIHAIEKAFALDDIVLWADSSMYLMGDLSRIENLIIKDGYFMEESGHHVKTWCNDYTRKYFNLQPEEDHYTMFSAGLLGLNARDERAMEWFARWKDSAKAGCFKGDWKDHRHDMTCGSIIACRMGFTYHPNNTHLMYIGPEYPAPHKDVVFYCQGI